jgi:hypothetical protein
MGLFPVTIHLHLSALFTFLFLPVNPGCLASARLSLVWSSCFLVSSTSALVYCYVVVSCKAFYALQPFSDLLCVLIWILIIPDLSTTALWQIQPETPGSESWKTLREMEVDFADKISLSYSAGFFSMPYNLPTWGRRLYFSSEGSCATNFYLLKNPSCSAGFEPANLGSSGTITTRPPRPTQHLCSLYGPPFFWRIRSTSKIELSKPISV